MTAFYLDEDVSFRIMPGLVARGHDVVAAKRHLPPGTSDHEQLSTAVRLHRTMIIHNRRDFLLLHCAWRDRFPEWGAGPPPAHPGILCLPQHPALHAPAAAEIVHAFVDRDDGELPFLTNRFVRWVPNRGWVDLA